MENTTSTATVEARSAMHARAQIVERYGIDQHRVRVTATKVAPGRYEVRWEATR